MDYWFLFKNSTEKNFKDDDKEHVAITVGKRVELKNGKLKILPKAVIKKKKVLYKDVLVRQDV